MNSVDKIKDIIDSRGVTPYTISMATGVSEATLSRMLSGKTKKPNKTTINVILNYLQMQGDLSRQKKPDKKEYSSSPVKNKVPVFEIDVTSSIVSSFNDVLETPSYYLDYEPFNDCTAVVNNFGDSMFPKYKNGERLAVKQIQNLQVINWGETYLVVTNANANDLRTVKDIHPHTDDDKIILRASNPNYAGDTVIMRVDILAMFAVKGKISQNFI